MKPLPPSLTPLSSTFQQEKVSVFCKNIASIVEGVTNTLLSVEEAFKELEMEVRKVQDSIPLSLRYNQWLLLDDAIIEKEIMELLKKNKNLGKIVTQVLALQQHNKEIIWGRLRENYLDDLVFHSLKDATLPQITYHDISHILDAQHMKHYLQDSLKNRRTYHGIDMDTFEISKYSVPDLREIGELLHESKWVCIYFQKLSKSSIEQIEALFWKMNQIRLFSLIENNLNVFTPEELSRIGKSLSHVRALIFDEDKNIPLQKEQRIGLFKEFWNLRSLHLGVNSSKMFAKSHFYETFSFLPMLHTLDVTQTNISVLSESQLQDFFLWLPNLKKLLGIDALPISSEWNIPPVFSQLEILWMNNIELSQLNTAKVIPFFESLTSIRILSINAPQTYIDELIKMVPHLKGKIKSSTLKWDLLC